MTLTQPAKNRLIYIAGIIIFLTNFEFAVLRPVACAIGKYHHTGDNLLTAHMRNIIALDARWDTV